MFPYLFKRILLFIPTVFVIALFAFGLSKLATDDPVLQYDSEDRQKGAYSKKALIRVENHYKVVRKQLGLDKPPFYFSINSQAYPDTIYKFLLLEEREALKKLIANYGNWSEIERYFNQIKQFEYRVLELPKNLPHSLMNDLKKGVRDFYDEYKAEVILSKLEKVEKTIAKDSIMTAELETFFLEFKTNFQNILSKATPYKTYIPDFKWQGVDNQFHNWFFNFLTGDFGYSLTTRQASADRIFPALRWTLLLNFISIFLAYFIAVPIGIKAAANKGGRFDKNSTLGLFMLYSLPSFWIGTLLLIFFTTKAYGMEIFQGVWAGNMNFDKFGRRYLANARAFGFARFLYDLCHLCLFI